MYTIERSVWLPQPIDTVFEFFSDARNLQELTPSFLQFNVITPAPITMEAGTLIDYKLKVRGLPIKWRTRINVWEPPHRFVDEQLRGPYRMWLHEHAFEEVDGGTLCRDRVDYKVPGGAIIHTLFVKRDVHRIFDHRTKKLRELFGGEDGGPPTSGQPS